MSFSRKKTQTQGGGFSNNNNNQQRNKPRFSQGGGQNNGGGNRPRKNYGAMREKYLAQAREALASGDRVLAENYYQHADHCYRMIAEEQASRPQRQHAPQEPQAVEAAPAEATETPAVEAEAEGGEMMLMNVSSLPAFLTANYEAPKAAAPAQDWEERDQA